MSARILIADDLPTGRIQWRVRLAAAHYQIEVVDTPDALTDAVGRVTPDLVILSHRDFAEALALCEALKSTPAGADTPLLLATPEAGPEARLAALAAGAADLLEHPPSDRVCMARIRSLLRARDARSALKRRRSAAEEFGFCEAGAEFNRRGNVALVARSRLIALEWRTALNGNMRDRVDVLGEHAALSTAGQDTSADVYVVDIGSDRVEDGLQFLAELRARAEARRASVIAVVGASDADTAARALDLGASDLIRNDFRPGELAHRIRTQIKAKTEADALSVAVEDGMRLAATDPLTGLYNRRYVMGRAKRLLAQSATSGRPLAVLIADIDHFKRVNDTYGHAVGDAVLLEVAARLRASLRSEDILARIGGEEFLILMPETEAAVAGQVASRICGHVGAKPVLADKGGPSVPVTLSIGVASTCPASASGDTIAALLDRADRALYSAKAAGRNQITVDAAA